MTSVVTQTNAVAALFYLVRFLPIAAFVVWRLRASRLRRVEHGPAVAVLCVLSLVCGFGLGRETLGHRVADTFGTLPILAMWTVAAAAERRPAHRIARAIASIAIVVSVAALTSAVWLMGGASETIRRTGVYEGVRGLVDRGHTVFAHTTRWPWAQEWPGANDWPVLEYVRDCSRPQDRLLITWHAPQFHFFSGRAFAGGETALMPVRRPPASFEAQVLERLKRQSVPIVLSEASLYPGFAASYPGIAAYLETRYRRAGEANYGPGDHILVHVGRSRQPTSHDPTFGFPCFG